MGGGKARLPFSLAGGRAGRGRTRRRGRSVRVCAGVARRCATTAASGACGVARGVRVVARHAWGRGGGARRQDTTRRGVRRGGACARLAGGGLGEDEGATGVLTVCRVVDVGLRCGVRLTGRPEWRGVAVRGSSDGGAHGPHRRVAVAESGDAGARCGIVGTLYGARGCTPVGGLGLQQRNGSRGGARRAGFARVRVARVAEFGGAQACAGVRAARRASGSRGASACVRTTRPSRARGGRGLAAGAWCALRGVVGSGKRGLRGDARCSGEAAGRACVEEHVGSLAGARCAATDSVEAEEVEEGD